MVENIKVAPNFLQLASAGDYCFVEDSDIHPYMDRVEKIILYKWNRHYPADHYFDISLLDGWVLNDIVDFKGSSHEKITREVYQNEKKY